MKLKQHMIIERLKSEVDGQNIDLQSNLLQVAGIKAKSKYLIGFPLNALNSQLAQLSDLEFNQFDEYTYIVTSKDVTNIQQFKVTFGMTIQQKLKISCICPFKKVYGIPCAHMLLIIKDQLRNFDLQEYLYLSEQEPQSFTQSNQYKMLYKQKINVAQYQDHLKYIAFAKKRWIDKKEQKDYLLIRSIVKDQLKLRVLNN
eukprot:403347236